MKRVFIKQILSVVLTICLLAVSMPAVSFGASSGEFNLSVLESSPYYQYDKFEKTWRFTSMYRKEYRDATVQVIERLSSFYVEKGWGPELRITYYDKEAGAYDSVSSFEAYVDGAIYSFEKLHQEDELSCVLGGNVARDFFNSLDGAQEVAFRFKGKTSDKKHTFTSSIDPVDVSALKELIEASALLEKSNAWSTDKDLDASDSAYGATMDKSGAKPKATPKPAKKTTYPKTSETYSTLQSGNMGTEVYNLQNRLIELGYLTQGGADGDYGGMTSNAVSAFQHAVGLPETGIANNETQQYLYANGAPKAKVYNQLDYNAVARYPDANKGKMIKFSGRVLQVSEDGDNIIFRIATRGNYDDVVYCFYEKPSGYKRVVEKDLVNVYGVCEGVYTYTTVQHSTLTIPACTIERIEVRPY